MRKFLLMIVSVAFSATAHAKAPAAPSNLKVKPLGVNSFRLTWKDNSKDEKGWKIEVSLASSFTSPLVIPLGVVDLNSYVVFTNELKGKTVYFRVSAYNGEPGAEKFSKLSPTATAKALPTSSFGAPSKLKAKTINDGGIRLSWDDLSTSEQGYQIEFKTGSKKWKPFATTGPDLNFKLNYFAFLPATEYSFRVRAFKQSPVIFTPYSNEVTAKTLPFQAPSDLVATPGADAVISLKWKDRSSIEAGFEIESRSGSAAFAKLGEVGPNVTSTSPITGFAFDTTHEFRLRSVRLVDGAKVYSAYSKVTSVKTPLIATPVNLVATTLSDAAVKLAWQHTSGRELGFQVQYRETGIGDYVVGGNTDANATEFTLNNLPADKSYQFRIRAYDFFTFSSFSGIAQAQTKDGITGNFTPPILVGKSFRYPVETTLNGSITSLTVTGLPAGLTYNSTTRTISGTISSGGTFNVTLTATFSNGTTSTRTLILRSITGQPFVRTFFPSVSVAAAAQKSVSLTDRFADPDTVSAVRFTTTKGNFDIILFPDATPLTVDNFLDYVDAGLFLDTFFHRAPPNFVVQGGGYKHTTAGGYSRVSTFPSVPNEPGLSNVLGTVAMAKLEDLPNSATSQFFVNLKNNAANLDAQNGGFTVFGRVSNPTMAVINGIAALPIKDYTVPVGAGSDLLEDLPVNAQTAPVSLDPALLVKITDVDAAPILTYEVTSQNTAIATASLSGSEVLVNGVAKGSTTISVKATDLDGLSVTQSIPVTVP
jgi:cyclophilin family peptidyl-prolyl cis-trans isomerase